MNTLVNVRSATLAFSLTQVVAVAGQQSTFKLAYDDAVAGGALSAQGLPLNNLNGVLVDDTYVMESLLVMYKKTNDLTYLQLFISHVDKVMNARDDMHIGGSPIANYHQQVEPTWVSTHLTTVPYGYVYASGMLLWPMAEYCRLVSLNPSYYVAINATNSGGAIYNTQTLKWIADDLHARVYETCAVHDDEFKPMILPSWYGNGILGGGYAYPCDLFCAEIKNGCFLPLNMQSIMAKVHLAMYMATPTSDATRKAYYKDKAVRIANTLRMNIVDYTAANSAHYTWPYWPALNYSNFCGMSSQDCWTGAAEDRGHAYLNSSFAFMCYEYGLPYQIGGQVAVFDGTDMQYMAATFKNQYLHPLMYSNLIDRNGPATYGAYNFTYPDLLTEMAQWIPFSKIDEDIWQAMSEVYTERGVQRDEGGGTWLLGVANCFSYQDELDPIYVGAHGTASEWRGAAIGDFDANGEPDVAAVRDFDGDIYVYKWQDQNEQCSMTHTETFQFGSASDWIGLAAGDIDNEPGDELIAVRQYDEKIFVYKWGTLGPYQWLTVPIASSTANASGVATGDFDDDGDSEVILSTYDGEIMLYDFNSGQQDLLHLFSAQVINNGIVPCIATANLNGNGADELILVNNYDNSINVFEYDGVNLQFGFLCNYIAPELMNWIGATGGQFDAGHGPEECAAVSYSNGDVYFLEIDDNGQLVVYDRANFMGPITSGGVTVSELKHSVIASGDLTWRADECPMDEVINYRNEDGWCYAYELRIGGRCFEEAEGDVKSGNSAISANSDQVRLYPNPAAGQVFIESNDTRSNGIMELVCLDNIGRVVLSERYPTGSTRVVLWIGGLASGVYSVRTTAWSGSQSVERLIIK